jgi:hypothetical protein
VIASAADVKQESWTAKKKRNQTILNIQTSENLVRVTSNSCGLALELAKCWILEADPMDEVAFLFRV